MAKTLHKPSTKGGIKSTDLLIAAGLAGAAYFGAKALGLSGPSMAPGAGSDFQDQRTEAEIAAEAREITRSAPQDGAAPVRRGTTASTVVRAIAPAAGPAAVAMEAAATALRRQANQQYQPERFPLAQFMRGPKVAELQILLNKLGASLKTDGMWGPATTTALKKYFPTLTTVNANNLAAIRQRAKPNPRLQLAGESKESWLKRNGFSDNDINTVKKLLADLAKTRLPAGREMVIKRVFDRAATNAAKTNLLRVYRRLHPAYTSARPFNTNLTAINENWGVASGLRLQLKKLDT